MLSIIILSAYYIVALTVLIIITLFYSTLISNLITKVPFVPTKNNVVNYILQISNIKKEEKVYDLGCGDGRFLFKAEKITKEKPIGYENAIIPYLLSQIGKKIHKSSAIIKMENFLKSDLSKANVIFCYLGPEIMQTLYKKIKKECKKGTRIYSQTFKVQNIKPSQIWLKDKEKGLPTIYLYKI